VTVQLAVRSGRVPGSKKTGRFKRRIKEKRERVELHRRRGVDVSYIRGIPRRPEEMLSGPYSTLYATEADDREGGSAELEEFLLGERMRLIVKRVNHPQTNGKIEVSFDMFKRNAGKFEVIDESVKWYNYVRFRRAFDVGEAGDAGIIYHQSSRETVGWPRQSVAAHSNERKEDGIICR
jgi:hypothetical protein